MRKSRVEFTKVEDQYIVDHHLVQTNREIGVELGRPTGTINGRKNILEREGLLTIVLKKTKLTVTEQDFIKDNFWELGTQECAKRLGRSDMGVYRYAMSIGLECNPLNRYNHGDISCFTQLKDPFVIYFLGYFWADGTLAKAPKNRVVFKIKKQDFEVAIRPYTSRLGDFWSYREYSDKQHPHWSTLSVLDVGHFGLWHFLESYDYRIKSGTSADKILNAIDPSLRHYWWRGFLDGDGCVTKTGRICFNSGYNQDWSFVEQLGTELGITFTIERRQRKTRGGSKAVVGHSTYTQKLVDYLYQGESFGLERKRQRCISWLRDHNPKKPHSSQYRGVSWCKRTQRWCAQVHQKKKLLYSQRFDDEIEAARAYDQQVKSLSRPWVILNFPNG